MLRITLIVVISEDGFITRGDNPNPGNWSSDEDQKHYHKVLSDYPVCIMGNKTFQAAKDTLPKNLPKIVLTKKRKVSKHSDVMYVSGPVHSIVTRLSKSYDSILLIGGANTYRQFLQENIVNRAIVTVEPIKLKDGVPLFDSPGNPIEYFRSYMGKETSLKKLNDSGTLLYEFNR